VKFFTLTNGSRQRIETNLLIFHQNKKEKNFAWFLLEGVVNAFKKINFMPRRKGWQTMLTTLHQFMNFKKELGVPDSSPESKRHEVVARLYFLLNKLSEEQKITLLKLLLRDKMADYLFKLIIDLTDNQRLVLMKQLEQITSRPSRYDR
jgi:hypothetical protein